MAGEGEARSTAANAPAAAAAPEADEGLGNKVLTQDEIDGLLGLPAERGPGGEQTGIRALINSALVSYERLPMLEVVSDRLVRLSTTTLRNFTSDNVEVSLASITSVRFGDYVNSIPLPAILTVFRADPWDGFGLVTVDSGLIYAMIDVLLGGGRVRSAARMDGRPYTTIETALVARLVELFLADAEQAFSPLAPVSLRLDRMETNPRFATISRPANAAILIQLRVEMEDRGGKIELLLPYATIEPVRDLLLQNFMGEKFGRDPTWEGHLATEISAAEVTVDAVLFDRQMPLDAVLNLRVGQTIILDVTPDDAVAIRCGDVTLTEGTMGRHGDRISIQVSRALRRTRPDELRAEKSGVA